MILYHYTAACLIGRIKREGVTLGGVLDRSGGRLILRTGYVWLTANPNFHDQAWNTRVTIPYDRAEYRITVEIPDAHERNVIQWLDYCASGRIPRDIAEDLNSIGDPENWRLYRGKIPVQWFHAVDRKLIATSPPLEARIAKACDKVLSDEDALAEMEASKRCK